MKKSKGLVIVSLLLLGTWLVLTFCLDHQSTGLQLNLDKQIGYTSSAKFGYTSQLNTAYLSTILTTIPENKIVNLHNFKYMLVNNRTCETLSKGKKNKILLFTFIHSAPDHFKHRQVIRSTWGSFRFFKQTRIVTTFVLGKPSTESLQTILQLEYERYQDIIQEDFIDTYRNLTYKVIAGFKWITYHCQEAAFILKADDDILINIFSLQRYLEYFLEHSPELSQFICRQISNFKAIHDKKSKWFVQKDEYPHDYFPNYCSGSAYILPTHLVPPLYNASFFNKFFWIDDVYLTGILAQALNISHINSKSLYCFPAESYYKLLEGEAIFAHMSGNEGLNRRYNFWKEIMKNEDRQ